LLSCEKSPMVDQTRNAGIDIVKAIGIVLVVIWHCQPTTVAILPDHHTAALIGKQTIKFFYFNISLLAVPSFILVSLYLFIGKLSKVEDYWKKRFLRLFQIYVFWVGIQFILYLLLGGSLPLPLKTIIRSGGPDLSYGFSMPPMPSIFYYLYSLIVCTVLMFLFFKLPEKIKLILSIVVIGSSCLYFFLSSPYGIVIDTRSMKNYYVYIPLAYYLYHYKDKFIQYRSLFLIGFVLSIIAEWNFTGIPSAYGRVSIILGSLFCVSMFVSGGFRAGRPALWLSRYSLGIFALHSYVLPAVMICHALLKRQDRVLPAQSAPEGILLFAATFAFTCLGVWLFAKTKLRVYVS